VQHLEHGAPQHLAAIQAPRARLALAVPGLDAVLVVDDVQTDGK
jgi:hypothetical protein